MIILKIVIVMFLWAICFPLITLGLPLAPHLSFATLRAAIAGAVLIGIALTLKRPMPKGRTAWWQLTAVGIGATTFGFLGMFHAAEFVSPGVATVIANTQPLLAAFLAHYVLGEQLDLKGKAGLALGLVGIVVITAPQLIDGATDNYLVGIAYILLAAVGITVSNVMIKKISGGVDAFMAMGWQLLLGAIPLGVYELLMEDPTAITWSGEFLFSLLGLALFGTALAYWLWCRVLQEVPLTRANVFSFLVPLFGLAMGVAFYNEILTLATVIGAIITVLGVWLVSRGIRCGHPSSLIDFLLLLGSWDYRW